VRFTNEGLLGLADEVWKRHEPDDSGLCPVCKIVNCRPRRDAAAAREVYQSGINVVQYLPPPTL
jgi:hypothetical protein